MFVGVLTDRHSRVVIVAVADALRSAVLVLLAVIVFAGRVDVVLVLLLMFVMGAAEVFSNTASGTLLPAMVAPANLAVANARVQAGLVTVYQLVGPPIGALLFASARWLPFLGQAVLLTSAAALVTRVSVPAHAPERAVAAHWRADIASGVGWVVRHAPIRTLVLTIFIFNITFGAAWSVLVLYATRRLNMGPVGFSLLTTATAVGGLFGTATYGWMTARVSLGQLMRIGLIIETLTHLALAITTTPGIALGVMFVFGAHAFVWSTTSITVRQRAVPPHLQGRVSSINSLGTHAGLVVGAALGGPIAVQWGITAPFWFGFAGSAAFLVVVWRQLANIAHGNDDQPTTRTADVPN